MVAYIKFRWGHGDGDDVERLWKKLSRTYLGSCRQAFDYAVERIRKGLSTCRTKEGTLKAKAEDRRRVPRPVARLFGRDPEKLCASDREYMRKLGGLNSEVERAYELAQGFSRMLRVRRHLEMLDGWLEKASPADRPSCAALPKVYAATTAPFARLLEALEQRADRRPDPPPQALKEADVR